MEYREDMKSHLQHIKEANIFISEYGGLNFDNVKFRPGAPFTTDFGLDSTFNDLRLHTAIDRGTANGKRTEIFSPFLLNKLEINTKYQDALGIQLRLHTPYGFEIRIAHIEKLPDETVEKSVKGHMIEPGEYLCETGNAGISTGAHTHVELVSYDSYSFLLEHILERKHTQAFRKEFTLEDVVKYLNEHSIVGDPETLYTREKKKKNVISINQHYCRRLDYLDGNSKTFYSTQSIFGM